MFQRKQRAYVIAEIGGNFSDYETAVKLIDKAAQCGVDAVKLQTYRAETIASRQAVFDMENTGVVPQQELFRKGEISEALHQKIFDYARTKELDIFSTPSHITDVEILERLHVDVYKLGADDLTNIPFLKTVARLQKPIMLSTGMGTLSEVREAVDAILEEGNEKIVIMHVASIYPTAPQYVNLKAIQTLQREFSQFAIGYSDHTLGVDSCIFAAVMGAEVIEKHFTYDKNADGPDHILSADPEEMKTMVDKIRLFEVMRGSGIKHPQGAEVKNRINNRKSLICIKAKKMGEQLAAEDIEIKRPGTGIAPREWDLVVGRYLAHDIEADTVLQWTDIK